MKIEYKDLSITFIPETDKIRISLGTQGIDVDFFQLYSFIKKVYNEYY